MTTELTPAQKLETLTIGEYTCDLTRLKRSHKEVAKQLLITGIKQKVNAGSDAMEIDLAQMTGNQRIQADFLIRTLYAIPREVDFDDLDEAELDAVEAAIKELDPLTTRLSTAISAKQSLTQSQSQLAGEKA